MLGTYRGIKTFSLVLFMFLSLQSIILHHSLFILRFLLFLHFHLEILLILLFSVAWRLLSFLALILCVCSHRSYALGLEVASFCVSTYSFFLFVSLASCLHHFFILPFWWNLFLLVDSLQWKNFFPPFVFIDLQWFQGATPELILSLSVLVQLLVIPLSSVSLK